MKILRTALFAAAIVLAACTARASEKEEGFSALTVDQVSDLIAKKEADVFDNNSKDEWKDGHVPTAKWVKFSEVKASDLPADHSRKLVFYCHNEH
jgi:rhodanese-related sulfurtransferase